MLDGDAPVYVDVAGDGCLVRSLPPIVFHYSLAGVCWRGILSKLKGMLAQEGVPPSRAPFLTKYKEGGAKGVLGGP
ncbi:hypothetical protein CRG98_014306 [Punica granatum]|uniref:Uncharacterized protein n=1 Tax=Punica granatum TaxID=22663 RepID=A0A2I0K9P4_PUNGR|nr:hypothetical protein CRG98_014306 [Punica granatum]